MGIEGLAYLTVEEAIVLHVLLMREWREERFGVDRKDLLESALNRPINEAYFEGGDIARQAATLCFGLVKNHPWLGGNKRTASFLTEFFLEMNGYAVDASDAEFYDLVLKIESDVWKTSVIEEWLRIRIVQIESDQDLLEDI